MPDVEIKSREFYTDFITPDAQGNIKANSGDMLIFAVQLLLDMRDVLIDMHGMLSKQLATGKPTIHLPNR